MDQNPTLVLALMTWWKDTAMRVLINQTLTIYTVMPVTPYSQGVKYYPDTQPNIFDELYCHPF